MDSLKRYQEYCERYPLLSLAIRNSLMSKVTNSVHKRIDRKQVISALNKVKYKNKKILEIYLSVYDDSEKIEDVIPSVVRFFENYNNLLSKKNKVTYKKLTKQKK